VRNPKIGATYIGFSRPLNANSPTQQHLIEPYIATMQIGFSLQLYVG
jgi:hypothetical protein